jgi:hypothetical protein
MADLHTHSQANRYASPWSRGYRLGFCFVSTPGRCSVAGPPQALQPLAPVHPSS